jgi:hypothetical protein
VTISRRVAAGGIHIRNAQNALGVRRADTGSLVGNLAYIAALRTIVVDEGSGGMLP